MFKNIAKLATAFILLFLIVSRVQAAGLSIRLEQPKSPTNQNTFDINFVTLDTSSPPATITVKCFKKGPSDGGFAQFGSDIVLTPAGGNSGNCPVTGSIITGDGTYEFKAQANGTDSNTATVLYNTSGPDTPTNYSKEQVSSCIWRIKFKTANDAGKTVKVEVYRSDATSFNADGGTRVATVSIGSNTDGSADVSSPDCSKTYYFAIRAFDSAGNGSGVVGDSVTNVTTITLTASPTTGGAIAVSPGFGSVLGEKSQGQEGGEVKAESTQEAQTPSPSGAQEEAKESGKLISTKNIIAVLVIMAIAALGFFFLARRSKTV